VILINPPVSKPCEPPAGLARLYGVLTRSGRQCAVMDANLEGLTALLNGPAPVSDTWTKRALGRLPEHLDTLHAISGYENISRYTRAVSDLNRILQVRAPATARLTLANYEDEALSPTRSADLIRAAENPEENIFSPYFSGRMHAIFEKEPHSIAGFSLNYLSQAVAAFAMMGFVRREWPGIKIVLGGGLVTTWMRSPGWRNPFSGLVDVMAAGPGENILLSLTGGRADPDALPSPDFRAFSLDDYFAPGRILPYSAAAGCYWGKCSFCPERAEGNPYLPVGVLQAMADLRALCAETKPVLIHLLDNAVSPALMKELCDSPPGIPWYGFTRLTPHLEDPEFCAALRESGCVMLQIGLESGDQGVLERLEKGVDLGSAARILKNLAMAGIGTYVYLLFGTPAESEEEARKTLEFVAAHRKEIGFLNVAIFNLPLNAPEASTLSRGGFYKGDLSLYTDFIHPKGWDRTRVRRFLDREFKRHPAIAEILRRDPPVFTSNHAPFFLNFHRRDAENAKLKAKTRMTGRFKKL
jgi:hypothetical protein